MRHTVVGLALVLGAAFVGLTPWTASVVYGDEAASLSATFQVDGMSCEGCANGLVESLKQVEGVEDVVVQFSEAKAVVVFAPKKVTTEELLDAISKRGFTATLVAQIEGEVL